MVVEVADSIEDGEDDGDRVVLGKLALCGNVVNARFGVLVKLDELGREESTEKYKRCGQNR